MRECLICDQNCGEFNLPCKCNICEDCLCYALITRLESTIFVKDEAYICPNSSCFRIIDKSWILENIQSEYLNKINEILLKKYLIINKDIIRCSKNECQYIGYSDCKSIIPSITNKFFNFLKLFFYDDMINHDNIICNQCNKEIKLIDNEKTNSQNIVNILTDEITEIQKLFTSRPCFNCKILTYKITGCDHISCICGSDFCYSCLENYKTHNLDNRCKYKYDLGFTLFFILFITFLLKAIFTFKFCYSICITIINCSKPIFNFSSIFFIVNFMAICLLIAVKVLFVYCFTNKKVEFDETDYASKY